MQTLTTSQLHDIQQRVSALDLAIERDEIDEDALFMASEELDQYAELLKRSYSETRRLEIGLRLVK